MAKEISIEKKARALCASIRLKDEYYGERIETALAKKYGLKEYVVSSLILEEFLKDEYWKARELQARRMEYEQLSPEERALEARPMSVRDYFDVPTQYHFYKYIQMIGLTLNSVNKQIEFNREKDVILKKQTIPFINKGKEFDSLSELLGYAYRSYEKLDPMKNMFFTRRDVYLNIHKNSMGSYKSLRKIANDASRESGESVELAFANLKESFESEIFDYMIDYVSKYKNITSESLEQLKLSKHSSDYLGFTMKPDYQHISLNQTSKTQLEETMQDRQLTIQEFIEQNKNQEKLDSFESAEAESSLTYGINSDGQLEFEELENIKENDELLWIGDYEDDDLETDN